MAGKRVAILGATGVVGTQMRQCLEERNFPVSELVPLASAKSAGKKVTFKGEEVEVKEAKPEAFDGVDIVLGAAGDGIAKAPLVVPEINPEDIQNHPRNIIANPNCATIIGLVPTYPLHKAAGLKRMIVSTYQAASGAGMPGLTELTRELKVLAEGGEVGDTSPFAYQLAMNLIPQIGSFKDEGYTSEEWKMQNEGRKIIHLPEVRVNCTCVRVPIMRSHSESITLEFENPLSPDEAREILSTAPGVKVVDDPANLRYPMPLDTSDQDLVFVGRIRRDLSAADGVNGLTFFCCGDQIRKGAATNAVQIAEYLV